MKNLENSNAVIGRGAFVVEAWSKRSYGLPVERAGELHGCTTDETEILWIALETRTTSLLEPKVDILFSC